MDSKDATAVVDTNVLVDICSCHDLVAAYEQVGEEGLDGSDAVYRQARLRESLLLAIYFHTTEAVTVSLKCEPLAILERRVDPDNVSGFETHYTTLIAHFVREELLSGWTIGSFTDEVEVTGNQADDRLLEIAKEDGLPLITNEGYGPGGITQSKLRKKAADAGVEVFTPRQFWEGKLDEAQACRDFIDRFNELAPEHVKNHSKPDVVKDSLLTMLSVYRHILYGETNEGHRQVVAASH